MMKCPCCQQELKASKEPLKFYGPQGIVIRGDRFIRLSQSQATVFGTVYENEPRGANFDQLINALYAHRPDGGPLSAKNTASVLISQANARLKKLNTKIVGNGHGRQGNYHVIEQAV